MYIYQNGKLYTQLGENILVGVEIYSDKVLTVKGTETTLAEVYDILTKREVQCKFHIEETPYIFPNEKVVTVNEPVIKAKRTARKPK